MSDVTECFIGMSTAGKLQLLNIVNSYKESVEIQQLSCQALAIHAATGKDILGSILKF